MPRHYIRIEGEIPDDAEGMSVQARFSPDAADDVQGQGLKFNGLLQTDEDAEGHGFRGFLKPEGTEEEDAVGNMPRFYLEPASDEEAEGNALGSHVLQIERDADGELIGRFVSAEGTE